MGRIRDRRDTGRIARRRPSSAAPRDVDHLDRLVEADELDPDGRRERLDVDDDDVDQPDPLGLELLELGGDVAAGEDAGVDRVVEGLDLAADVRLALGQRRDGHDLDAFGGEVVAGPVGGDDLDPETEQVARQLDDPVSVRH